MAALVEQPIFLFLAGSFGLGVFLLAAGPIFGSGRPDLITRLRRLDPDAWLEEDDAEAGTILGTLGEDISRTMGRLMGHLGLIAPHDLSRVLEQSDLNLGVREFYQDKVVTALGLEVVLVVANLAFERLGLLQVGVWPLWVWSGAFLFGFLWPDIVIRRGASERLNKVRAELPRLVDMLVVASSTGRGVQDAILDVESVLGGPLGKEWSRMTSQLTLGLTAPLQDMASRNGLRELDVLVGHLVVAHERGQGLEANLVQLSETLREQRLHELTAEGGRANGKMFLPVVFLVYMPLLVLVMAPVAATLAGVLNA